MLLDFRVGSAYPNWIPATYNKGVRVVYKFSVYECTEDGTTTTPPGEGWQLYLSNFIGSDLRKYFTGQKVVLEFALNEYYQTQFRQPPLVSDIYITNSSPTPQGFVVGLNEGSTCSTIDIAGATTYNPYVSYAYLQVIRFNNYLYLSLTNNNTADPRDTTKWHKTDTIAPVYPIGYDYNFIINVPSAIYNSVSPSVNYEMRQIVDKIVPESIKYIITPY